MDNEKMLMIKEDVSGYVMRISKESLERQLKPDLSKLKEGDEVWVRKYIGESIIRHIDIIAHFPKEEKVGLPEKIDENEDINWKRVAELVSGFNKLRDYLKDKEKGDGQ